MEVADTVHQSREMAVLVVAALTRRAVAAEVDILVSLLANRPFMVIVYYSLAVVVEAHDTTMLVAMEGVVLEA